jgi:broad specificity phosphatase PhoE
MKLLLIRHAETADGNALRCHGWTDVPLSLRGHRQAQELAKLLATFPVDAIFCSDLRRSVQTAEIVAARHDLTPRTLSAGREINFGDLEGCLVDEIPLRFPETFAAWNENPATCHFPNGESFLEVKARVIPAVEKIVTDHAGKSVALVLHSGVNRVILGWALGLPDAHIIRLDQDHACLNIVDFDTRGPTLRLLNYATWKYAAAAEDDLFG